MTKSLFRAVSIDPTRLGLAYAVLEGSGRLVDWGIVELPDRTQESFVRRVSSLLDYFEPQILVLEDGRSTRRKARARRQIAGLIDEAAA